MGEIYGTWLQILLTTDSTQLSTELHDASKTRKRTEKADNLEREVIENERRHHHINWGKVGRVAFKILVRDPADKGAPSRRLLSADTMVARELELSESFR